MGVLITDHDVRDTLDIGDRAYISTAGRCCSRAPRRRWSPGLPGAQSIIFEYGESFKL